MLIMQKGHDGITINMPLQVLCARVRARRRTISANEFAACTRSGGVSAENTQLYEATRNEIYESRDS